MKATTLLTRQHKKALGALKKLAAGNGTKEILDEVATELVAHMLIEETIFYPVARQAKKDLVLEAYEEHAIAQLALKRLLDCKLDSDVAVARATTLKELIEHHAEEEEDELFPRVEKALGDDVLDELGAKMKVAFETFVAKGWRKLLPSEPAATTPDKRSSGSARAA